MLPAEAKSRVARCERELAAVGAEFTARSLAMKPKKSSSLCEKRGRGRPGIVSGRDSPLEPFLTLNVI